VPAERGWRLGRPSLGATVSTLSHGAAFAVLLFLGHAASEPSGALPGRPDTEVAIAFGLPDAPAAAVAPPLPEPMPIPELAPVPLPEPDIAEPTPEPEIAEPEPEPILLAEAPPADPVEVHLEPAKAEPQPKPQPQPRPKPQAKPQPQPRPKPQARPLAQPQPQPPARSEPAPTETAALPQGLPDAAPAETPSAAPAAADPAKGRSAQGAEAGPSAPADGGLLVLLDPAYREPPTPPRYPSRAVMLGQQGQVVVRAAIDERGAPEEVVVWTSSGFPLLDKAAVDAVKRWRFVPARRGGGAVAAWVQVPVNFKLR